MTERKETDAEATTPVATYSKTSTGVYSGLTWYWHVTLLLGAIAIIYTRQPDMFLHPQFIAEDGKYWFADAYNSGWFRSLFVPHTGYFQTLPRLAAALALLVPLKCAPTVMAAVGLAVQILPVFILLSGRLRDWGSLHLRMLLALIYLALPNCAEINVTITEAQWHLAFCVLLLIVAQDPESRSWRLFDYSILGLCAVTGPFVIMLLPSALYYRGRTARALLSEATAILAAGAAIQLVTVAFDGSRLHGVPFGDPKYLIGMLAGQVYVGTLLGHNSFGAQLETGTLAVIAIFGTAIAFWWWRNAKLQGKTVAIFALAVLGFTAAAPIDKLPYGYASSWQLLSAAPGIRYWFFPTLAFAWMLVQLLTDQKSEQKRIAGCLLLLFMGFGFVRDWRFASYPDAHFEAYAERFSKLRPGDTMTIPEPDFRQWSMTLRHR